MSDLRQRRGQGRHLVLETQRRDLGDLGPGQALVGVGDLVRIDVLRQLADDEVVQVVRRLGLPEDTVARAGARIGAQRLQLRQGRQVFGIPHENARAVAAQVVHDQVLALRVDQGLVHVGQVLTIDHGSGDFEGWVDDLERLVERAVVAQRDHGDGALVAVRAGQSWGSLERRFLPFAPPFPSSFNSLFLRSWT